MDKIETTLTAASSDSPRFVRVRRIIRWIGLLTLTAFLAAWMPTRWMVDASEVMGMEFPDSSLAEYLARHLSLLYGMVGVAFVGLSFQRELNSHHVRLLGYAATVFGVAQASTAWQSQMPLWWTLAESLSTIFGGMFLCGLAKWSRQD